MKKVIIVLATICVAAVAQAAAVVWSSGSAIYDGAGNKVGKNATLWVYEITSADYSGSKTAWELAGDKVIAGTAPAAKGTSNSMTSKFTNISVDGTVADTTYYYAVITTIGTGDDMKYIAEKATVTTGGDGNGAFTTVASSAYTAAGAKGAWASASSAAPEPTSGLLLLLGMAGLALKRKRA